MNGSKHKRQITGRQTNGKPLAHPYSVTKNKWPVASYRRVFYFVASQVAGSKIIQSVASYSKECVAFVLDGTFSRCLKQKPKNWLGQSLRTQRRSIWKPNCFVRLKRKKENEPRLVSKSFSALLGRPSHDGVCFSGSRSAQSTKSCWWVAESGMTMSLWPSTLRTRAKSCSKLRGSTNLLNHKPNKHHGHLPTV